MPAAIPQTDARTAARGNQKRAWRTRLSGADWGLALGGVGLLSGAAWALVGGSGRGSGIILSMLVLSALVLLAIPGRRMGGAFALLLGADLVFMAAIAVTANRARERIETSWPQIESDLRRSVAREVDAAVSRAVNWAESTARRALLLPNGDSRPFRELQLLLEESETEGERGIVLFRAGRPWAWAGMVRQPVDSLRDVVGVAVSPFYVSIYARADSGNRRAVALQLLHAEEPGDALARPIDALLPSRDALAHLEYAPHADDSTWHAIVVSGRPLLAVRAIPLAPEEFRQRRLERARARIAILLGIGVLLLLGIAWRQPTNLIRRLVAVAMSLGVVAMFPLNTLSNRSAIFDPTYFFVPGGGPFTASVGALAISSALLLLVLFPLLRARFRVRRRWLAAVATVVVAAIAPYLLRQLSNGISPPSISEGTAL
ncbi:MAG TPA: hypothetical protein VJ717_00165, partial [Gemmatimonadaceae bacterium]|nr:hypothetical protein [Gemmatimonadaceae bacterium]